MNYDAKILVTGGCGFIGSYLIDELLNNGYRNVTCVDNLSGMNMGSELHLNPICEYIYGDLSDYQFIHSLYKEHKFDVVFHLAANANVPFSDKFPATDFRWNAEGTFNVLNCCLKLGVKKVVFASSAAVYGNPQYTPMDEKHPLDPISNYGITKLYGEKLGMCYFMTYELPFTALRVFNTYGPRQPRYVIHDLIKKIVFNRENLEVLGTGRQIRDYCYIKDTVNAFITVMESNHSVGKVFNVAGGNPTSIKDLANNIVDLLGLKPTITYTGKSWKGDVEEMTADLSKIKTELGFLNNYDLKKGLEETVKWFAQKNGLNLF
ncbi:MAG: GDP-mannose 4,6-dehydratase [Desulfosporosinus sp.]|nr:GDP-mannose 4,6-dehydratase [Desulfosporosinus sp.]